MANNWLDAQHRAYAAYCEKTENEKACSRLCREIQLCGKAADHAATTFFDCEIHMDWVEQIEQALPFIENAVYENRQFILKEGDIVPIEKAKRVSKASVEHLSRHSEMITKVPLPGEDVIPDKLYITENVGTFAVYENRFLYMLLCYLQDFVTYRYKKIKELVATFSTELEYQKDFSDEERKISFHISFSEQSTGMPGVSWEKTEKALERIYGMIQTIEMLLKTDLMKEVADAPVLRPPIARTNVLMHDPNFRVAFELYSFVTDYGHDGFSQVERYTVTGKIGDAMQQDLAAILSLTSYISYRNGGLLETLEKRYLEEQIALTKREEQHRKARIAALKEQLPQLDDSAAEYILELENTNQELESKTAMLYEVEALRKEAEAQLDNINSRIAPLQAQITQLQNRTAELLEQGERDANTIRDAQNRIQNEQAANAELTRKFIAQMEQQNLSFQEQYRSLTEKYDQVRGINLAAQAKQGITDSYISKEAFSELEAQYHAFRKFYEKQWQLAKKQIRKDILQKK